MSDLPPIIEPTDITPPAIPPTIAQQVQVNSDSRLVLATGFFPAGTSDPDTIEIMDLDEEAWIEFQAAPVGEKYLAADGTLTVVPYPPPPIQFDRTITVKAQVVTTDDVPLIVFTFPCDTKHLYQANLTISGVDRGNFVSKIMEGRFTWKRPAATAVVVGLTVVSDIHDAAAASWAPNYAPQGINIIFTVKGAVGRTIDWLLTGTVGTFAPEGLV